jgi:hypothetical protein
VSVARPLGGTPPCRRSRLDVSTTACIDETLAVVSVHRDGSIDWRFGPRFDALALFAALLGTADDVASA